MADGTNCQYNQTPYNQNSKNRNFPGKFRRFPVGCRVAASTVTSNIHNIYIYIHPTSIIYTHIIITLYVVVCGLTIQQSAHIKAKCSTSRHPSENSKWWRHPKPIAYTYTTFDNHNMYIYIQYSTPYKQISKSAAPQSSKVSTGRQSAAQVDIQVKAANNPYIYITIIVVTAGWSVGCLLHGL